MLFEIISYTIVGIFVSPLFFPVRWYRRDQRRTYGRDQRRTYGRNAEIYGGHHNIHHSEDDSEHDSEYDRTLLISK
jgi:hypothetical protein